MPIYSYKCKSCGNSFDLLTGEELACTKCGSQEIEKNYASFEFNANVDKSSGCGSCGGGCCGF
ncbi:MAG: zinc ribbon domain-containing protein [Actinomycetota bacterium]|jgi:putative FmdB family regulatory protein|nr:zinc ribbon domain-containing protein [Actinomycetota bacterium]